MLVTLNIAATCTIVVFGTAGRLKIQSAFSEALCPSFKNIFQPLPPYSDLSSFYLGKPRAKKELQCLKTAS